MNIQEMKQAILELSPKDRLRLMREVGPELCESMMGNPDAMGDRTDRGWNRRARARQSA